VKGTLGWQDTSGVLTQPISLLHLQYYPTQHLLESTLHAQVRFIVLSFYSQNLTAGLVAYAQCWEISTILIAIYFTTNIQTYHCKVLLVVYIYLWIGYVFCHTPFLNYFPPATASHNQRPLHYRGRVLSETINYKWLMVSEEKEGRRVCCLKQLL
jgi:hypothetical protein